MFIITGLELGGAEMMLLKLLTHIDRRRFAPQVISLAGRGELADDLARAHIPVHAPRSRLGRWSPASLMRVVRLVRSLRPDILQGWMYHGNLVAELSAAFLPARIPVLWNIRGTMTDLGRESLPTAATIWLGARLSRRAHTVINNSRVSLRLHAQQLGYATHNARIIPNGFDVARFAPSAVARAELRRSLGIPAESFLVGHVGRLHPMKDHETLLQATALAAARLDALHLIVVGADVDRRRHGLEELARELGVRERVHFVGPRRDVQRVMAALDIGTLTSSYGEGFPNSVGETMACAVPCVVTDVGDSAFLVGDTGMVVPPRDPAAVARAWLHMASMSDGERAALGARARRRVVEQFSLQAVIDAYQDLYERCARVEPAG